MFIASQKPKGADSAIAPTRRSGNTPSPTAPDVAVLQVAYVQSEGRTDARKGSFELMHNNHTGALSAEIKTPKGIT